MKNSQKNEFPIIGKVLRKVSNHWKSTSKSFQWLEKCSKKFPMVGNVFFVLLALCFAVQSAQAADKNLVIPDIGPFAGGNRVTVTNVDVTIGNGSDITNILVGTVGATNITAQGTNWFTLVMPTNTVGTHDLTVQSPSAGETVITNAYTYNYPGQIGLAWWGAAAWTNMGGGLAAMCRAMTLGEDGLFAAGNPNGGIQQWNFADRTWTNLGSGNGSIYALLNAGGKLYIGGRFTEIDGVSVSSIAEYDLAAGTVTNLGSGMDNSVYALAHDGTNLYAGGNFSTAGGVSAKFLAVWNGSSWSAIDANEMNASVESLLMVGNDLYAAGNFTTIGALTVNRIAKWNGSSWSGFGSGLGGECKALAHDGTNLYAAGGFSTAGGSNVANIAKWDGVSWTALGSGLNGTTAALEHDGSNLYAGGYFTVAGGVSAARAAIWNGTAWTNMGSGMNSVPLAMAHDGTNLYAGGDFTTADGVSARKVAQWGAVHVVADPGIVPNSGSYTGGYDVVITGSNLCNGSDCTNVTLNGIAVTSIDSQSSTQIIATVAYGNGGDGDVTVYSTSFGVSVLSNGFTYNGPGLELYGTNGALMANGAPVQFANGTRFPSIETGRALTNTFSISNPGNEDLVIASITTNGTGASSFILDFPVLTIPAESSRSFPVAFSPQNAGEHTATLVISNNLNTWQLNLAGSSFTVTTNDGPYAGGGSLTISNGLMGSGSDITNVLVGSQSATITAQGSNWVTITLPSATEAGPADVTVQSASQGESVYLNAYTYNGRPEIGWTRLNSNAWQQVTYLPGARNGHCTEVLNGELFVIGGYDGAAGTTNVFKQTACGAWTEVAGLPVATYDARSAVFSNRIYVMGGWTTNVFSFDGTNWTASAGLPAARGLGAAGVVGNKLYYTAGSDGANRQTNTYCFDGTAWTQVAGLPVAVQSTIGASYNGLFYVLGGYNGAGGITNVFTFDGTNWTETAGMPVALYNHAATVYNGKLYVIGGYGSSAVYSYDGTSWSVGTSLPTALDVLGAASFNDSLYSIGGSDGGPHYENYRYPSKTVNYGVEPLMGGWTGTYQMVITGTNLCDGTVGDITGVTLCGYPVTVDAVNGSTQIVVTVPEGSVQRGDAVVSSIRYGVSTGANVFAYLYGPEMVFSYTGAQWQATNITLQGNANWYDGGATDHRLLLTYSELYQVGSAWVNDRTLNPSKDWTATFAMNANYPLHDGPADGMGFHLQTNGTSLNCFEHYASDHDSALTIRWNTYQDDYIAVYCNRKTLLQVPVNGLLIDMTAANAVDFTASYDASRCELSVSLHQPSTGVRTSLVTHVDLGAEIGTGPVATFGFSGRTGGATENNQIDRFRIDGNFGAPSLDIQTAAGVSVVNGAAWTKGGPTDFGYILHGSETTLSYSITNSGLSSLIIDAVTTNGASLSNFVFSPIPSVVQAGGSSNFTVTFTASDAGEKQASLTITPSTLVPFTLNFGANVYTLSTTNGPQAGGNVLTITNGILGNGSDITNVTICGAQATITGQGSNWVSVTLPASPDSSQQITGDVVIQSTSEGDTTLSNAYTYNPAGVIGGFAYDWSAWEQVEDLPVSMLGSSAGGVLDGAIYTCGGRGASSVTNGAYRFDGTNWAAVSNMPVAVMSAGGCVYSNKLYIIGGATTPSQTSTNVVQIFDGTSWSFGPPLPENRHDCVASIINGEMYVAAQKESLTPKTNVYRFTGSDWIEVAGVPEAKSLRSGVGMGDTMYLLGGLIASNTYSFNGTGWTQEAGLPRYLWYTTPGVLGTNLYCIGGYTNPSGAQTNVLRFSGTTWEESLGLPQGMEAGMGATMNGMMYCIGSYGISAKGNECYRYPTFIPFTGVSPSYGISTGGVQVTIVGTNLCDGSDVTNVAICGASVQSIVSQSSTQVVVITGSSTNYGTGDVVVYSTSYGITTKNNAFSCYVLSSYSGPAAGGGTLVITNGTLGDGSDITNVTICGVQATITGQGADWVSVTLPVSPDSSQQITGDVIIQSVSVGDTTFSNAYTYNPAGTIRQYEYDWSRWEEVEGLPQANNGMASGVMGDNLYVAGGYNGAYLTNTWRFDGANWSEVEGLPMALYFNAGCTYSGRFYSIGGSMGSSISNVWSFDGTSWREEPALPFISRQGAASVLNDSLYYFVGRNQYNSAGTNVFRFDGSQWTQVAGLPVATFGASAFTVSNRMVRFRGKLFFKQRSALMGPTGHRKPICLTTVMPREAPCWMGLAMPWAGPPVRPIPMSSGSTEHPGAKFPACRKDAVTWVRVRWTARFMPSPDIQATVIQPTRIATRIVPISAGFPRPVVYRWVASR